MGGGPLDIKNLLCLVSAYIDIFTLHSCLSIQTSKCPGHLDFRLPARNHLVVFEVGNSDRGDYRV